MAFFLNSFIPLAYMSLQINITGLLTVISSWFEFGFFLNKNYEDDVSDSGESNMLLKYINKFKESYDTLNDEIKENFLNYIIVLTDKSFVYYK